VQRLGAEEGDVVAAGTPLVVLENDEQRIAAEKAAAQRDIANREAERAEQLHRVGVLTDDARDARQRQAQDAARAAELAELELSRTIVRAPFAGKVLRRHLDVGATVSDGTPVYDLADVDPLHADVNVPERHVVKLERGQGVRLTAEASGETAEARVERIAPSVHAATGTVKVTLAVRGGSTLRPGTFVRADIVTETHEDALVVPRSALVAEGRQWHVFRLPPDADNVELLLVTPGFEEADRVEVVPAGDRTLAAGDRVVVAGASALSEGARVRVVEAEQRGGRGSS
jgi:membrane fusion protein (multidrug efflux system)